MSPKGKIILLLSLVGVLGITAAITLPQGKPKPRPQAKSPSADAAMPAGTKTVSDELTMPSDADLKPLLGWLADTSTAGAALNNDAFGVALPKQADAESRRSLPGARAFEAAPKLSGIMWIGESGRAMFGNRTYGVGDQVEGTSFQITEITRQMTVTLASSDGRTVQLNMTNAKEAKPQAVYEETTVTPIGSTGQIIVRDRNNERN